jgi:hypothetical protein
LYKNEFQNWGGVAKPLVEKTPQYPYYSLPFRGQSEYKKKFTEDSISHAGGQLSTTNTDANRKRSHTAEKLKSSSAGGLAKDRQRPSSAVGVRPSVTAEQIKEMQSVNLRLSSLSPMKFEGETTNQREFLPFKVKERPKTAKPKIDVR